MDRVGFTFTTFALVDFIMSRFMLIYRVCVGSLRDRSAELKTAGFARLVRL